MIRTPRKHNTYGSATDTRDIVPTRYRFHSALQFDEGSCLFYRELSVVTRRDGIQTFILDGEDTFALSYKISVRNDVKYYGE
jgi:hypothetical protein